ncbi:MAG: hypothetical protein KGH63_02450 [Candidatus Micrarchaeota archaeon]|nr:hypothetical protein [Candidatus Micrarchaeota archaeon]
MEVLLASLLLFGALLVAASLITLGNDQVTALPLLRFYATDTLAQGGDLGAWTEPVLPSGSDNRTRALVPNLPPGVCAQVEVYANQTLASDLEYSYVNSSCNRTVDLPVQSFWRANVVWKNSSAYDFYWVRVKSYPSGGGD